MENTLATSSFSPSNDSPVRTLLYCVDLAVVLDDEGTGGLAEEENIEATDERRDDLGLAMFLTYLKTLCYMRMQFFNSLRGLWDNYILAHQIYKRVYCVIIYKHQVLFDLRVVNLTDASL